MKRAKGYYWGNLVRLPSVPLFLSPETLSRSPRALCKQQPGQQTSKKPDPLQGLFPISIQGLGDRTFDVEASETRGYRTANNGSLTRAHK